MPDEARPEPDGDSRAPKTDSPPEKSSLSFEPNQPVDDLERLALMQLWLTDGVGPTRVQSLIDGLGSAAKVVEAPLSLLQTVHGIGPKLANLIRQDGAKERAEAELARQQKLGIRWESWHEYAERLRAIVDPPIGITLLARSRPPTPLRSRLLARAAAALWPSTCRQVSPRPCVSWITVERISARALMGLHTAGRSMPVDERFRLGQRACQCLSTRACEVAERIINEKRGAIISEASCDVCLKVVCSASQSDHQRLSEAIIVIEASMKSGALYNRSTRLDQNRDCLCRAWSGGDPTTKGPIGSSSRVPVPITCIEDLLDALPELTNAVRARQAKLPPTLFMMRTHQRAGRTNRPETHLPRPHFTFGLKFWQLLATTN